MGVRIEKDSFGEREIPAEAFYGVHTLRSMENFNVAGEYMPLEIIYAMIELKWACALANQDLGQLSAEKAGAIARACERTLRGDFADQFRIDVFQAGSGTSSNMNVNEVIANVACTELGGKPGDRKLVHPNDDVNMGQSTNNVFPSGIKVAVAEEILIMQEELRLLIAEFHKKEDQFSGILKSGRTHLQDAVPVTLGQEFGAYAHALEKASWRVNEARQYLLALGVGGNAIGTGINTKAAFRKTIMVHLNRITGDHFHVAENGIEITQFMTDIADVSSSLKLLALDLLKICNDLRLLSSGPNTGIGEISLPPVEPGSSIMPGKINPSICEAANMACLQVVGNDTAVALACGLGQLELNTHMPLIGLNVVKSLGILRRCCTMLADKCVSGIEPRADVCAANFNRSAALATVLNPQLGYDRVATLVKECLKSGRNMRELVLEQGIMTAEALDDLLSRSTGPTL